MRRLLLITISLLFFAGCYEESSYGKNYMKPPNKEDITVENNSSNSDQESILKDTFTYIVNYYEQPIYIECLLGGAYSPEYYHYSMLFKIEDPSQKDNFDISDNAILCSNLELQTANWVLTNLSRLFSYEYGYIYHLSLYIDNDGLKLDEVISKEKSYKEFTLTFDTYSLPYINNDGEVIEKPRSLFEKVSESRYIAYRSLEFEVYYQDLIEELDLRLESNETVTLTFNFEDNGTIYLQKILEES